MVPKSNYLQIFLNVSTQINLKMRSKNLILMFQHFISKIYIWGNQSQSLNSSDLLGNLHARYFESVESKSATGFSRFFIQNLDLGK